MIESDDAMVDTSAVSGEPTEPPADATLVESLRAAIVRADGDTLVMHVGECPYVVALSGIVELSTRPLSLDAMRRLLGQLLPRAQQLVLDATGAVEHELDVTEDEGERFRLVAARGGDDIWTEIRRYRKDIDGEPFGRIDADAATTDPDATAATRDSVANDGFQPDVFTGDLAPTAEPGDPGADEDDATGVVVPLQRLGVPDEVGATPLSHGSRLDELIQRASSRGASTLYLVARSRPMVRVDGDVTGFDDERELETFEVDALIQELDIDPGGASQATSPIHEWIREVPDVGRVRCLSFHDHRGPGLLCRITAAQAASADQLGLAREIQNLVSWPDGLVLVTGHRLSGKSTLVSALVDLINQSRAVHVITFERQIRFVHESRRSFISQREVRGDAADLARAVRAAIREDPDVLVIGDMRAGEVVPVALEAAEAGRLVIGAFPAPGTVVALERLLEHVPAARRVEYRRMLAGTLRGVVGQVLLKKTGGGRLAARELLLNTPSVASLIAEGKLFELPKALDSGRQVGMVPLNDALAAFVRSGATDVREAYRGAIDRDGLVGVLRRAGIDTSFIERRA